MVLFPEVPHLNPTGLNVVGSLLTANRLQESHQVGDQIERWRHRWINDKSQPDLGPGVQPHIAFLLSNIGNRVVEETNADVDQNNDDNHLQTKLIERTDLNVKIYLKGTPETQAKISWNHTLPITV